MLSVDPKALPDLKTETWVKSATPWNPPPFNYDNPVLFIGLKREKLLPIDLQEKLIRPYSNARVYWLDTKFKRLPLHLPDIVTRIRVFISRSTRHAD